MSFDETMRRAVDDRKYWELEAELKEGIKDNHKAVKHSQNLIHKMEAKIRELEKIIELVKRHTPDDLHPQIQKLMEEFAHTKEQIEMNNKEGFMKLLVELNLLSKDKI